MFSALKRTLIIQKKRQRYCALRLPSSCLKVVQKKLLYYKKYKRGEIRTQNYARNTKRQTDEKSSLTTQKEPKHQKVHRGEQTH